MLVNIADLKNPETGETYREENAARSHKIPLGALVEIRIDSEYESCTESNGLRLFVVRHGRDCDQTPLYNMSYRTLARWQEYQKDEETADSVLRGLYKANNNGATTGGYSESSLTVIALPKEHARGDHVCDYVHSDGTVVTGVRILRVNGDKYLLEFTDAILPGTAMQLRLDQHHWVRYDQVRAVRHA